MFLPPNYLSRRGRVCWVAAGVCVLFGLGLALAVLVSLVVDPRRPELMPWWLMPTAYAAVALSSLLQAVPNAESADYQAELMLKIARLRRELREQYDMEVDYEA